ncbi:NHL repeat-containing protein [Flavobacterium urocaniciphilum]|uniref:Delta-60 repeat domain-containing protein n=1 Tax=Flavobacterium urocaniciphilum TaxID=1299341 RepID=A0A1H9D6K1_9FLAO|nr:hypothetical protein [Flavobacterium urocaniciphilum]SEQ09001.1 delta-60 repeat domain-containing protein [Flavobacterium urocaniciphilum]
MKFKYNLICLLFAFQILHAQQGILDTSFGNNGINKASKITYYNGDGNPRGTIKALFTSTGTLTHLGNDLVNGGILPVINSTNGIQNSNTVWNNKTVVKDGLYNASNILFTTGYTSKEDNNKAIYISKTTNNTEIAAGNALNYDGKIIFDTKETDEEGVAIKLQSDNKIVVLGYSGTNGVIIRYTAEGYLDRTFNQKGFYIFQIAQTTKPTSLAIQPDGKILIAGNCLNGNTIDFFITRLNTNGTTDTNFGSNGIVIKDINNYDNTGNSMILTTDGSILIGGKAYTTGGDFGFSNLYSYNFSVFKYTSNGILDTSASNGVIPGAFIKSLGFYQYNPSTYVPEDEEINCMAYDNINERVYIYGSAFKRSYDAQYNIITRKTGLWSFCFSLDNSFTLQNSTSFQFPTDYTLFESEIISATIKPSDMVLGSALTKVHAVVKFSNCLGGTSTFLSIPSTNSNSFPTACYNNYTNLVLNKIIKQNNIYYGLTYVNDNSFTGDLYQLDSNFKVNTAFGLNGKIPNVRDFRIDNDGNLICSMTSTITNGYKTLISKFDQNGKIDYTFGNLGSVKKKNLMNIFGLQITSDNKYVVASYITNPEPKILLEKFNTNGQSDTNYNDPILLNISNYSSYPSLENTEEIISDNLGYNYTVSLKLDVFNVANQIITLSKVNNTGVFDTTFGTNGMVNMVPFFNQPTNKLNIVIQDNGKLLVYSNKRLVQINTNGTLDTNFGTNGYLDVETIIPDFNASKVLAKGNDYYIGGFSYTGGDNSTIIKINNLGIIDSTFANNGIFKDTDTNSANISYGLKNMYFDGNDKIVFHGGGSILIKRIQ